MQIPKVNLDRLFDPVLPIVFFFQAEDCILYIGVTGVQTCALPISGPNGLAAAVELARNGRLVALLEGQEIVGGGTRSAELTLPGFVHDIGSAIHPLGYASPYLRMLQLEEHGLEWVHPPAPLAHPFDDGTAAVLERSVEATAAGLGRDAEAYRKLMGPIAEDTDKIAAYFVGSPRLIRHPLALATSGLRALRSARGLAEDLFEGERSEEHTSELQSRQYLVCRLLLEK